MNRSQLSFPLIASTIFVLFVIMTWPVWRWLWGEWWGNDYYGHGLLILPLSIYLAWRRIANSQPNTLTLAGDSRGLLLLGSSFIGYILFINDKAYFLAAFACIGLIAGLIWTLAGFPLFRLLLFPVAFLGLMVPLPFIEQITLPLALFTGVCSGFLVNLLGLDVTIIGTAVVLPNANLVIGAQCSGMNSIITLLSLTVLMAYILQGPLWGRITLIALSIPLAMLGNVLRVASLLFVARYFNVENAFVFYHDYSGFVAFLLILLLMIPLSKALKCKTLRYEIL